MRGLSSRSGSDVWFIAWLIADDDDDEPAKSGDVEAGNDEKHVDVDCLPAYSGRLTVCAVSTSACPRHEREVLLENEVVQEQSRDIKVCADVIEVAMRLTALVLWHDKPC